MRFPLEIRRDFTSLDDRLSAFKCVNSVMLSRRVDIFIRERYNSCNFIRAPTESRRISSLESAKLSLSKLTRFLIKLVKDFSSLEDRSRAFKWVQIFVLKRFNPYNFIRALVESARLTI